MTNENDIIFDNVYEDECDRLDTILLEVAKEIKEEGGYSKEMVERIIDTWCEGVGIRIKEEWHEC